MLFIHVMTAKYNFFLLMHLMCKLKTDSVANLTYCILTAKKEKT